MLQGLTHHQVETLLKQYGPNVLEKQKKDPFWIKLIGQFNNYLTILLIIAALLSFLVREMVDGSLILGIVILNACFGLYQESKAEEAIAALRKMTVTQVRVFRDGAEKEIDSRDLVPGDVIFLEEGMKVPADSSVLEIRALEINEAALTGESLPVSKNTQDEIFMGTIVSKGRGYATVIETGMRTRFGKIAESLIEVKETKTPLQQKLESLTRTIGMIGIVASIVVFGLSFIQGSGYFPSFLLAISLAVAIVPEGLPAVMTITLSIGVKEMAKNKAIIRKLSAIEALGSVTLIATDKTGTLTTNRMQVKDVYFDGQEHVASNLKKSGQSTFDWLLLDSIVCSTANLVAVHDHGSFDVLGDPTEGALLILAQKLGIDHEDVRNEWKILEEVPFDSVTRQMRVKAQKDDEVVYFRKGAPESIMVECPKIKLNGKEVSFNKKKKEEVEKQLLHWAKKGLRVIAYSYAKGNQKDVFLGLVALHDPPRAEVKEALIKTNTAGIKVVMMTGDNEITAEAIGTSIGLLKKGEDIMTGLQLDKHTDEELLKVLPRVRIFARISPFQKHRIVKLYQELGEIVAVTGDGVNDAIALKQADVGVAMGLVGTDVARETADMILTDDNFATIVRAIEEGRNIIKNLKNAIKYLLSCNLAEAATLIIGLLFGMPDIFYPLQLLYINLVTDGLPALALAFSPKHGSIMQRGPEQKISLFARKEKNYVSGVGILTSFLVLGALFIFTGTGSEIAGRTAAFSVLALIQSFILLDLWLNHRLVITHIRTLTSLIFMGAFIFPFLTQWLIVSQKGLAELFQITSVSGIEFAYFVGIAGLILVGIEGLKRVVAIK